MSDEELQAEQIVDSKLKESVIGIDKTPVLAANMEWEGSLNQEDTDDWGVECVNAVLKTDTGEIFDVEFSLNSSRRYCAWYDNRRP